MKLNLKSLKLADKAQTGLIAGDDQMAYNQSGEPRKMTIEEATPTDPSDVVYVRSLRITRWRALVQ